MYQVTIKGKNLKELKKAVSDINDELHGGRTVTGMTKDMNDEVIEHVKEDVQIDPALKSVKVVEDVVAPVVHVAEIVEAANKTEAVSNAEVDVNGLPWDARIHSATKNKNADNSWRNKRGVDKDLLAKVESELKVSTPKVEVPVIAAVAPVIENSPTVQEVVAPALIVEAPKVAAPAPAPTLNLTGGHTVETFKNNYAMIVAQLITDKKITQEYVNQLKDYFNVNEIWEINDEQKENLFTSFVSFGFIQSV